MLRARIVDEDVHAPEGLGRLRHHRLDLVRAGEVMRGIDGLAAARGFQRQPLLLDGPGIAEAIDDEIGTLRRESLGISKPDSRRGSRYQRRPAFQSHACFSLMPLGSRSNVALFPLMMFCAIN